MNWPEWTTDDGRIRLINADCLEVLPTLEAGSVDAVVTDPPYGVELDYQSDTWWDSFYEWERLMVGSLPEFVRISTGGVFVSTSKFEAESWLFKSLKTPSPLWRICWFKGASDTRSEIGWKDWESVFVFRRPRRQMHDHFYCGAGHGHVDYRSEHPCPKPYGWASHLVGKGTRENDLVLDAFSGTATTAIACIRTGRRFIGIEKERKYWEIGIERVKKELGRTVLFDEPKMRQAELIV